MPGTVLRTSAGRTLKKVVGLMNELIDERTLLIVGCTALVLACLLGIVTAVIRAKRKKAERRKLVSLLEGSRDWQPTWRVNAVGDAWLMEHEKDNIPANFVLRIEEDRLLRDLGGGEIKEIRWRLRDGRSTCSG